MNHIAPRAKILFNITGDILVLVFIPAICIFLITIAIASETLILIPIALIASAVIALTLMGAVFALSQVWYKNWLYELTDSEIRIQYGIISRTYKTIPYSKVQNIDIYRGLVARMLGLAAVNIHTAGYGGAGAGGAMSIAEGRIPAVTFEEAQRLNSAIINKIKKRQTK